MSEEQNEVYTLVRIQDIGHVMVHMRVLHEQTPQHLELAAKELEELRKAFWSCEEAAEDWASSLETNDERDAHVIRTLEMMNYFTLDPNMWQEIIDRHDTEWYMEVTR